MTHNLEQFRKDLKELGFALDGGQEEQFLTYYELLVKWNEVMNLTAITEYLPHRLLKQPGAPCGPFHVQ